MEPTALIGAISSSVTSGSPYALALLAALGVMCATFGVAQLQRPSLVAQRLGSFGESPRSLEEFELQLSFRERVVMPLVRGISGLVLRYTPASTLDGYKTKLILAGSTAEVRDFLGVKGLLALVLGGGALLGYRAVPIGPSPISAAIMLALLGFYLPNILLSRRIKARQKLIQRALPDTLDLLTICVEAGLGFDAAIQRVVEKRNDELSREFGRVLAEMRVGRSRREALRSLAERTDVVDVNTFISSIVQSEQLGVPISKVLFTQAQQMRMRRRQRAEEAGHKAPVKMLMPMAFLIFPSLFIILLGPTVPKVMSTLGTL